MSEGNTFKKVKLFKVSRELNIGVDSLIEHLNASGFSSSLAGSGPNAAITDEEAYLELLSVFADDKALAARVKEKRAARETALPSGSAVSTDTEPAVVEAAPETTPAPEPIAAIASPAAQAESVVEPADEPEHPEPSALDEVVTTPEAVEDVPPAVAQDEKPVRETEAPATEADAKTAVTEAISEEKGSGESDVPDEATIVAEPVSETVTEDLSAVADEPVKEIDIAAILDSEDDDDDDEPADKTILADRYKLAGTKVMGKIDLKVIDSGDASDLDSKTKKRRKRISGEREGKEKPTPQESAETQKARRKSKKKKGPEVDATAVEQTLQETLRELEMGASRVRQRRRRQKRDEHAADRQKEIDELRDNEGVIRVTEFLSTGELAAHMDVAVNDLISTLFAAGMMVSINQRLDADTITFVADEFGFEVEFIRDLASADIILEEDNPEDLVSRAPVVTVMGHVDHGKTSLLDYIRSASVVSGEAGGITQHIGAYHVVLPEKGMITFLDTPGHEAFTAMRARGAQVTDIVILVVAADDAVMPQTIEAINHAKAANVPIVVAVNKIDKNEANPDRVIQQLSDHGVLVEQYGGKVQCEYVSAHTGQGVHALLDRVLLEAELLDLKANPDRSAICTVIESRKERGRGNVASVLVRNGTLRIGDPFIAGIFAGRVRAMFDELDQRVDAVGPSMPVQVIGLDGSPEVGDPFIVMHDEREAKDIAQSRHQIHREQSIRQRKHITLDEIGRRLALGDFRELHLIVKGDVAGSVEALSDSLMKLSTEEVVVNIVHKGVGAISESDVTLALASNAIIIGFQVRPVLPARQLAEREEIDIRLYSVIYHAISEVHDALEGLLTPEKLETITGTVEVRETFKVPRQGMIAGCYVLEGKIRRSDKVHLIRDGVVIYDGTLASLRRFKDDVKEVTSGYECGIGIENFNDLKIGDHLEAYEIVEKRRKLEMA